jgi:hypothetical protein
MVFHLPLLAVLRPLSPEHGQRNVRYSLPTAPRGLMTIKELRISSLGNICPAPTGRRGLDKMDRRSPLTAEILLAQPTHRSRISAHSLTPTPTCALNLRPRSLSIVSKWQPSRTWRSSTTRCSFFLKGSIVWCTRTSTKEDTIRKGVQENAKIMRTFG